MSDLKKSLNCIALKLAMLFVSKSFGKVGKDKFINKNIYVLLFKTLLFETLLFEISLLKISLFIILSRLLPKLFKKINKSICIFIDFGR